MTQDSKVETGCRLVGDFTDEGPAAPGVGTLAEITRTQMVGDYTETWQPDDEWKDFTVLLKDGKAVSIRGHGLKHEGHTVPGQDVFRIVIRENMTDVNIAIFKGCEITGIFHGTLCETRRIV